MVITFSYCCRTHSESQYFMSAAASVRIKYSREPCNNPAVCCFSLPCSQDGMDRSGGIFCDFKNESIEHLRH